MTYSSEVLADSPLAYYRLGEASGTTAADSSGNARDGSYINSPTLGTTGLLTGDANTAVTFAAGSSQSVGVTNAAWMSTPSGMTIEAWIKTSTTGFLEIVGLYTTTGTRAWEFRVDSTTGALNFIKLSNGTTSVVGVAGIRNGVAHHVVATYDGSNIRLYVDGVLDKTVAATGNIVDGGANFGIGERASDLFFTGVIDEVAFYNTALSGTRIAAHYSAGTAVGAVSGTASLSLSASGAAVAAASGTAALSLTGSATAAAPTSGSASLSLSASGSTVAPVAASGTASLSLSASGAAGATGTGSASLDLSASGSATLAASGTASLTLSATGSAHVLYTTDTSNFRNGRSRHGSATVTITRAVAAPPATLVLAAKYDKAAAYPTPVMDNGRPT